jgi:NADP-reducing hydrogenase subunit HndB
MREVMDMKPTALLAAMKSKHTEDDGRYRVRVGMATCGISAGADKVYDAFLEETREAGLKDVEVISTGCVGRCDLEPMAEVARGNEPPILYIRLDAEKARRIVREHLAGGVVVDEYAG